MSTNPIEGIVNLYKTIPYHVHIGIQIEETSENYARVRLPFKKELAGGGNAYHGGAISSLMDLTGALAAWSGHDMTKGMKASTVSMTVNYLSAAQGEDVICEARALKRGKELIFCEVDVRLPGGEKHIATGTLIYRIA